MVSRLSLICQGATAATRQAAFPNDEPLEERAKPAIGDIRLGWETKPGWLSPMQASRQTAGLLSLSGEVDNSLRDLDYGSWAGHKIDEIAREQMDGLAQWLGDPHFDGHGGESISSLFERAGSWLDGEGRRRGHSVAVTHASVIKALVAHVLGAPPKAFWAIDIAPLTLTILSHDERRWTVKCCGSAIT